MSNKAQVQFRDVPGHPRNIWDKIQDCRVLKTKDFSYLHEAVSLQHRALAPTVVIIVVVFSYSHEICTVAKSILSCAFLCTWMSKWKFGVKCCQPPKLLQNWFIFLLVLTHSSLMIVKKGIVCKAVPFSGTLKLLHPKTIHKTGIL